MLIAGALAAEQRPAVAHSASYGKPCRRISQAPVGAAENPDSTTHLSRPVRGLNYLADTVPTANAVGYYLSLLRSFDLWRAHSPIC
jgi:hypothetical protein